MLDAAEHVALHNVVPRVDNLAQLSKGLVAHSLRQVSRLRVRGQEVSVVRLDGHPGSRSSGA